MERAAGVLRWGSNLPFAARCEGALVGWGPRDPSTSMCEGDLIQGRELRQLGRRYRSRPRSAAEVPHHFHDDTRLLPWKRFRHARADESARTIELHGSGGIGVDP